MMSFESTPALYTPGGEDHPTRIARIRHSLQSSSLPDEGLSDTSTHIRSLTSGIIRNSAPTYFGFVTGGVTPAAAHADNLVTELDANVAVHLPNDSIATDIEDTALRWLLEFYYLDPAVWRHRIFTTGATASNVLGLALGREYVVAEAAKRANEKDKVSVGQLGLQEAIREVGRPGIQVLTFKAHSSVAKAASIVGLGRNRVIELAQSTATTPLGLNWFELETCLMGSAKFLSIVVVSFGEVNTGLFSNVPGAMERLRALCNRCGAWLHVDAAFGIQARIDRKNESAWERTVGLELADSITGDAHKLLNVTYDCGFFFSRHPDLASDVFQNAGAAYLASSSDGQSGNHAIFSPLNMGIENSRRFRALPVYASLRELGRAGYVEILRRQVALAQHIAAFIHRSDGYVLLPRNSGREFQISDVWMIVLFAAKDHELNEDLVDLINESRKIWVSGTSWDGQKAARIAVANWAVEVARDGALAVEVLSHILNRWNEGVRGENIWQKGAVDGFSSETSP